MYCKNCGYNCAKDDLYCKKCGSKLLPAIENSSNEKMSNKIIILLISVAVLLVVFLTVGILFHFKNDVEEEIIQTDYEEIVEELVEETSAEIDPWQEKYDLGIKYLNEENYEEAIILFIAAIEIDAKNIDAYIKLAETYIIIGETEKAIEVYNNALEVEPDNVDIYISLAQAYISIENIEDAITAYEAIIDIQPENADIYIDLAELYVNLDDIEAAISVLIEGNEVTDDSKIESYRSELEAELEARNELEISTQFIVYKSDTTLLTNEDLIGLSSDELLIARNEIYARHGYIFKSEFLSEYFSETSWYEGTVSDASAIELSTIEWLNIQRINAFETGLSLGETQYDYLGTLSVSSNVIIHYSCVESITISYNLLTLIIDEGLLSVSGDVSNGLETFYIPISDDCIFKCKYSNGTESNTTFSEIQEITYLYRNVYEDGDVFLGITIENGVIIEVDQYSS